MSTERGLQARPSRVKIYDGFTFFTELDVLMVRLYELDPVVDYFILSEADVTHSNTPKPLVYEENKAMFAPWAHKIRHVVAGLPTDDSYFDASTCQADDVSCQNRPNWTREGSQRAQLRQGLHDAADDDVLMISDADEIPSRDTVQMLRYCRAHTPVLLRTYFFYYDLRWMWREEDGTPFQWKYPQAIHISDLSTHRINPNDVRYFHPLPQSQWERAGWHLSYFGGREAILRKIEALAHQENNTPKYANLTAIAQAIDEGVDLFERGDPHGSLSASGVEFDGETKSFFSGDFVLPCIFREQPGYCVRYLGQLIDGKLR